MGIFAMSSSSPRAEKQGRGWHTPAAALGRRPGARERLWSEGKERGRREGPIPGRSLARGGPRWSSHNGLRQRAAGGAGPVPQSLVAVKGVGESTGELGGSISPAHLGLEWSGEVGAREAGAAAEQACGGGAG